MEYNVSIRDVHESDLSIFCQQQLDEEAIHMAAFPTRDYQDFMTH